MGEVRPDTEQEKEPAGKPTKGIIHLSIINDPLAHIMNDHHLPAEAAATEAADEPKGIKKLLYG